MTVPWKTRAMRILVGIDAAAAAVNFILRRVDARPLDNLVRAIVVLFALAVGSALGWATWSLITGESE